MNDIFTMITILDRKEIDKFLKLFHEHNISVSLITLGYGTANSETLNYLGLEKNEKVVITSFVTLNTWKNIKEDLRTKIGIDAPGMGISFIVPLSSIGGKQQLMFLTDMQELSYKEESELKNTEYELIIVISNIGYTDKIMEAARRAKAGGGTVVHAKGTGMKNAEKFFGFTLASEKELIYIVTTKENKNDVMKEIMENAGIREKSQSIVFSLPVTSTAGIHFGKQWEDEAKETEEA